MKSGQIELEGARKEKRDRASGYFFLSPFYYNIYDEDNNSFDSYRTIYSLDKDNYSF